jgi:hypothetical protein
LAPWRAWRLKRAGRIQSEFEDDDPARKLNFFASSFAVFAPLRTLPLQFGSDDVPFNSADESAEESVGKLRARPSDFFDGERFTFCLCLQAQRRV